MRDIQQQIPFGLGLARSVAFGRCPARLCLEEGGSGSADTRARWVREEGGRDKVLLRGPMRQ